MKIFRAFFVLLVLICSQFQVQAQGVWTLQDCIDYAFENNLQVQLNQVNESAAKINYDAAKAARLPNLNATIGLNLNFAGTTDPATFEFTNQRIFSNNVGLNSSVRVYNGNRINNEIDRSWMEYHATEIDNEIVQNDIALAISSAYLQVLLAKEQLKLAVNQKSLTEEQGQNTQKLINAGLLPAGDMLDIDSQVARDELTIINANNALDAAYVSIKILMDLDDSIPFDVVEPMLPDPDMSLLDAYILSDIYNAALDNQPNIRKSKLQERIAKKSLDIAYSGKYPIIDLNGRLGSSYSSITAEIVGTELIGVQEIGFLSSDLTPVLAPDFKFITETPSFFPQLEDNFLQFVGANITIPIFNNYQVKSAIASARLGIKSAELNRKVLEQNLNREIKQAYADALAAGKTYEASKRAITALQRSYEFAQKKYQLGVATAFELLSAKSSLTNSELQSKANKYDYLFKLKVLDYYLGNPIQF